MSRIASGSEESQGGTVVEVVKLVIGVGFPAKGQYWLPKSIVAEVDGGMHHWIVLP